MKLGIPDIDVRYEKAYNAMWESREAVEKLPASSAPVAAALAMFDLVACCSLAATASSNEALGIAAIALRGLLPMLTGELAIDVAELVDNSDRPISEMRISRGITA